MVILVTTPMSVGWFVCSTCNDLEKQSTTIMKSTLKVHNPRVIIECVICKVNSVVYNFKG